MDVRGGTASQFLFVFVFGMVQTAAKSVVSRPSTRKQGGGGEGGGELMAAAGLQRGIPFRASIMVAALFMIFVIEYKYLRSH